MPMPRNPTGRVCFYSNSICIVKTDKNWVNNDNMNGVETSGMSGGRLRRETFYVRLPSARSPKYPHGLRAIARGSMAKPKSRGVLQDTLDESFAGG